MYRPIHTMRLMTHKYTFKPEIQHQFVKEGNYTTSVWVVTCVLYRYGIHEDTYGLGTYNTLLLAQESLQRFKALYI